jgi:hypothetical protein
VGCGFSVICCELWVLGWDSIAYSGFLGWGCCGLFGFRLSFQLWVVGFRLSVVCCGFSVGFRLLTVAFWVGDAVDFSVVGCGFSVVGFRLSVVSCGFSVGIRLLTVAFWVGDDVDFSVVGCGFSVVCCELWVLGWDSIAYSGFLGWG